MVRKIGRNDPCPCGSGNKYKKCCMELDEKSGITRMVKDSGSLSSPINYVDQFEWQQPQCGAVAIKISENMQGVYEDQQIFTALHLWNDYCSFASPIVRKPEVWSAAVEYCMASFLEKTEITQSTLSQKYGVSEASISQRSGQLWEFMDMMEQKMIEEQSKAQTNHKAKPSSKHPKQQAMELLHLASSETDIRKRLAFASQALELDDDLPDAYSILAEDPNISHYRSSNYYKIAMNSALIQLGPRFLDENKGFFWGINETRPFMRGKLGYALTCWEMGRVQEAVLHFEELLELNPNDNQGVRHHLIGCYLEAGELNKAENLLKKYKDDNSVAFLFNAVLLEYSKNGISKKVETLFKKAQKRNPFVKDFIIGKKKLPNEQPEYIGYGDENEAVDYVLMNSHLWTRRTELLAWI